MDTCRYCAAEIIWAVTEKGHRLPVNPAPVFGGNLQLTAAKSPPKATFVTPLPYVRNHVPHPATCPNARRKRKRARVDAAQIAMARWS